MLYTNKVKIDIPILETNNLILREINPKVLNYVFENLNNNEIMEFLALKNDEELSKEKEKYEKGFTAWNTSFKTWQLIDKTQLEIIGMCGFHTWYINHFRAEIGYAITEEKYRKKR